MTKRSRVTSAVSTHSPGAVKQGSSEFEVTNHQEDMMLIDPEDTQGGSTHSQAKPKAKGAQRASVAAAIRDEGRPTGGKTAEIPNEVDPAAGYLEQESGLPVINNAAVEDFDEDEDFEDDVTAEFEEDSDEDEVTSEFEDLADLEGEEGEFASLEDDGFDELGGPDVETDDAVEEQLDEGSEALAFEEEPVDDAVALLDADQVADDDLDEVAYAVTANALHVIRSNRIIASMGPSLARKVGMSDIYLSQQFQDAVHASLEKKGLRKGLVQAGFALAKVKLAASSAATRKLVSAKVEAQVATKIESMNRQSAAMEHAMAIAAVGINRRFFKEATNPLRASLESELTRVGVRGANRLLTASFAEHGVAYAKSIVLLAQKLAAMPEEVRNQYADALDLTNDSDFGDEIEAEAEEDELDEDLTELENDDAPTSITAALHSPARRAKTAALLTAGVSSNAMQILAGNTSLV